LFKSTLFGGCAGKLWLLSRSWPEVRNFMGRRLGRERSAEYKARAASSL
jgi:hypothetical protein